MVVVLKNAMTATIVGLLLLASLVTGIKQHLHGEQPVVLNADADFDAFIAQHGRLYGRGGAEYQMRQQMYLRAVEKVRTQNSKPDALWKAGLNHFADRTEEELARLRGRRGPRGGSYSRLGAPMAEFYETSTKTMPESFHWRDLKTSQVVKDQGACGSCWAVTTVTVLEANYEIFVNNTHPRSFAAQELVSCVQNPKHCGGSGGCDGATVELGMNYVLKNGIHTNDYAPYHASDIQCDKVTSGQATTTNQPLMPVLSEAFTTTASPIELLGKNRGAPPPSYLTGWRTLPVNEEAALLTALVHKGPVAVSVAAGNWSFYSSGIFDQCEQNTVVDHAVSLYGFAKDGSTPYYLIRNSWGKTWGENGFLRLLRKDHSADTSEHKSWCGIDNDPAKGVACDGDPSQVTVCGMCGVLYDSVIPDFESKQDRAEGASSGSTLQELQKKSSLVRREDLS